MKEMLINPINFAANETPGMENHEPSNDNSIMFTTLSAIQQKKRKTEIASVLSFFSEKLHADITFKCKSSKIPTGTLVPLKQFLYECSQQTLVTS